MSGRPPEGASFAVDRIDRRRSRHPGVIWAALLVGLVGFALFGRLGTRTETAQASPRPASAAPSSGTDITAIRPAVPQDSSSLAVADDVVLQTSSGDSLAAITGDRPPRRLTVTGVMAIRATFVVVSLEAGDGRVLDWQLLNVIDPDGGIRPGQAPTFGTTFKLPTATSDGRIWVDIAALDGVGHRIGDIEREVAVGQALQSWQNRQLNLMN